jgi:hypothetical protein
MLRIRLSKNFFAFASSLPFLWLDFGAEEPLTLELAEHQQFPL